MKQRQVYFAKCIGPTGEPIGAYKIGCSYSVEERIKAVGSGLPFTAVIEAVIPGGLVMEAAIHLRFKAHKLGGEYFRADQELIDRVAHAAKHGEAFTEFHDSGGSDAVPDGAVAAFLNYHDISVADVCERLGIPLNSYDKAITKPRFSSRRVVAAAGLVAILRKQRAHWPDDALRNLCGEFSPQVIKRKAAA